jgi:succinate dehydrogenase / fumarate reductase membrane anchor subunit
MGGGRLQQTVHLQGSRRSFWLWFLQRVSSVGLIIVLLFHMIVLHYVDPSAEITLADTELRLQSFLFILVDTFLLVFALFHGLNGVRNVAYDYFPKPGSRKIISNVLLIVGVSVFIWGAFVLVNLVLSG